MHCGAFGGFILRDGVSRLLRMRSKTLMVRSAAKPRVSNHEAPNVLEVFS
jgi:hypothetical protein